MSNVKKQVEGLLDDIFDMGEDLFEKGKKASQKVDQDYALSQRGRKIAKKGEDFLADKLGVGADEKSRTTLRKGVGTGAAAGALALLLASRSGRKLATLGGLAGLGVVAYRAHQAGKMPGSLDDVIGLLKGEAAETRSDHILAAMISAAMADGTLNETEQALIESYDPDGVAALEALLESPSSAEEIAALAETDQERAEIYAASCRIADGLNPQERDYLDKLAMALRFDPEFAARIETDVRTA